MVLLFALVSATWAAPKERKPVSDDAIYDLVMRKLANDQVVKGGGFKIDVKEGVVTLRGTVEQQKQKERAEKLTRKVQGVKKVDNELTIGPRIAR